MSRRILLFGQLDPLVLVVPAGPFYIGYVLAAHSLAPTSWRFATALVCIVPFLGAGTVLLNDLYDVGVDRGSPRKSAMAHVTGTASGRRLALAAAACLTVALALAAVTSLAFLAVIAALVVLALVYSVPPVQLSRRPGLDLAANAIGIGALVTVAGWVVAAGATLPPLAWLVTSSLGTGAYFVLTTLLDIGPDRAGGKRSVSVHLGWGGACALGTALIAAADVGIVYMSLTTTILNPTFLWVAAPIIACELAVLPIVAAHPAFGPQGLAAMSLLLFVGNLVILLSYLDLLGPF